MKQINPSSLIVHQRNQKSLLRVMHHDLTDLGLICLVKMCKIPTRMKESILGVFQRNEPLVVLVISHDTKAILNN